MPGRRRGRSGCSSALPYPPDRRVDCARNCAECKCDSCWTSAEDCINREIFVDESLGAAEHTGDLVRGHLLLVAAADPIEHAEVAIDGRERVMGLACDHLRALAVDVSLPTDDPLVRHAAADVV